MSPKTSHLTIKQHLLTAFKKLQQAPETKRKIIFWSVLIIIGLFLFIWQLDRLQHRLKNLPAVNNLTPPTDIFQDINLRKPEIDFTEMIEEQPFFVYFNKMKEKETKIKALEPYIQKNELLTKQLESINQEFETAWNELQQKVIDQEITDLTKITEKFKNLLRKTNQDLADFIVLVEETR